MKNIFFFKLDISNKLSVETLWKDLISRYKKINILVNNAAIARGKIMRELTVEQF